MLDTIKRSALRFQPSTGVMEDHNKVITLSYVTSLENCSGLLHDQSRQNTNWTNWTKNHHNWKWILHKSCEYSRNHNKFLFLRNQDVLQLFSHLLRSKSQQFTVIFESQIMMIASASCNYGAGAVVPRNNTKFGLCGIKGHRKKYVKKVKPPFQRKKTPHRNG